MRGAEKDGLFSAALAFCLSVTGLGVAMLAQVPGSPGRTTSPGASTQTVTFMPGLSGISCSGTPCSANSSNVSPGSHAASGTLAFNATHDASLTVGGASGAGAGLLEVSCDGGTTWQSVATASGSVGGGVSYSYPTPHCSGVSNLSTLLFRSTLSGGGGSGFNMVFQSPSAVVITW